MVEITLIKSEVKLDMKQSLIYEYMIFLPCYHYLKHCCAFLFCINQIINLCGLILKAGTARLMTSRTNHIQDGGSFNKTHVCKKKVLMDSLQFSMLISIHKHGK